MTNSIDFSPIPAVILTVGRFIFRRWTAIFDDLQVLKEGVTCLKTEFAKLDLRMKHIEDECAEIETDVQDIRKNGCHQVFTHAQK